MKEPISLDTALQIVGSLKVRAIKEIDQVGDPYEKELLSQKIDMYSPEEKMLYGVNDMARLSVMDKIVHYYSPLIKKMNEVEGN